MSAAQAFHIAEDTVGPEAGEEICVSVSPWSPAQ